MVLFESLPCDSSFVRPRLLVFIVAYKAEKTVQTVLTRIPARLQELCHVEVLVIDDASNDATFERAHELRQARTLPGSNGCVEKSWTRRFIPGESLGHGGGPPEVRWGAAGSQHAFQPVEIRGLQGGVDELGNARVLRGARPGHVQHLDIVRPDKGEQLVGLLGRVAAALELQAGPPVVLGTLRGAQGPAGQRLRR